jgi:hypothetical protein
VALVAKGEIFSMSNQQYEETLEEQSNKELASILGISYDEKLSIEPNIGYLSKISVNFFELTKYNCFIITS